MQANAQDTSLSALITAGRSDIASGQTTVENLLQQIIGEQDTAAAAEAAAASALAAIASLTTQQEQATTNIATAYSSSLTSIEVSAPFMSKFYSGTHTSVMDSVLNPCLMLACCMEPLAEYSAASTACIGHCI